ncbi:MAG: hypothetical protein P1P64_04980 [Treponemataceae bacterium]
MKKRIYGIVVFLAAISLVLGSCKQPSAKPQTDTPQTGDEGNTPTQPVPGRDHTGILEGENVVGRAVMAQTNNGTEVEIIFSKVLKNEVPDLQVFNVGNDGGMEWSEPDEVIIKSNKIILRYARKVNGESIKIIQEGQKSHVDYFPETKNSWLLCEDGQKIAAFHNLPIVNNVGKEAGEIVYKLGLAEEIAKAKDLLNGVKYSNDGTDILTNTKWAKQTDLDAIYYAFYYAEQAFLNANVSQAEVDKQTKLLQVANEKFQGQIAFGTKEPITSGTKVTLSWDNSGADFFDGRIENKAKTENGDEFKNGGEVFAGTAIEIEAFAEGCNKLDPRGPDEPHFIEIKTESGSVTLYVLGEPHKINDKTGYKIVGFDGEGLPFRNTQTIRIAPTEDVKLIVTGGIADIRKPTIIPSADAVSKKVKISDVKDLPEPKATAVDNMDSAVTVNRKIKSVIGGAETDELDWATAIGKTYSDGDKIIVTFTAKDKAGNEADPVIVEYDIVDVSKLPKVTLTCNGLDEVTDKLGFVKFYLGKKEKDNWGNDSYKKDAEYKLGTEVPEGSLIYVEAQINKSNETDGEGWIKFTSNDSLTIHYIPPMKWVIASKVLGEHELKGKWGQYSADFEAFWFVIELDKNATISVTTQEPK